MAYLEKLKFVLRKYTIKNRLVSALVKRDWPKMKTKIRNSDSEPEEETKSKKEGLQEDLGKSN